MIDREEESYSFMKFQVKSDLNTYRCVVRFHEGNTHFDIDVFEAEPYFDKWLLRFLNDNFRVGGREKQELTSELKPIELAREIITQWERPKRLEKFLEQYEYVIPLATKDEEENETIREPQDTQERERGHEIIVTDYEDRIEEDRRRYYLQNPLALDEAEPEEREQILKENHDIRIKYYEAKALREAAKE